MNKQDTFLWLRKYWQQLILLLALFFLVGILFQQCSGAKEAQRELKERNKQVADLEKRVAASEAKHKKDSADAAFDANQKDTIIRDLYAQLNKTSSEYKVSQATAKHYISLAQENAKKLRDSIGLLVAKQIDSAASEFDQLSLKYASIEYQVTQLEEALRDKDSIRIAQLKIAYDELAVLREAYFDVNKKYKLTQDQYYAALKKVKKRGFLNRMLAAFALGGITYGVLK